MVNESEMEITCRCSWDLPDGAEIVPYLSPVTPARSLPGGGYEMPKPTKPCPACGKIDPYRISSGWRSL